MVLRLTSVCYALLFVAELLNVTGNSYCLSTLQVFKVLGREGINVKMMSQGASKNNISLVVSNDEGNNAVQALHKEFFE